MTNTKRTYAVQEFLDVAHNHHPEIDYYTLADILRFVAPTSTREEVQLAYRHPIRDTMWAVIADLQKTVRQLNEGGT